MSVKNGVKTYYRRHANVYRKRYCLATAVSEIEVSSARAVYSGSSALSGGPQQALRSEVSELLTEAKPLRIAVGIATVGRPQILRETLSELKRQERPANHIIVSHCSEKDVVGLRLDTDGISYVCAPLGLTKQRNAIINAARDFDILVFFDDDFFPCARYLEIIEKAFQTNVNYQVVTGTLLADGIKGQGIEPATARLIIQRDVGAPTPLSSREVYNGYGCNMSVRLASVLERGVCFDENLPLYGWLEDVDFSRRVAHMGKIVRIDGARGVHLGIKIGRTTGVRLGYSQIANPIYMVRRGSLSLPRAFGQMMRNVFANLARTMFPEPNIDRAGRLRGNLRAVTDLFRRRCHPKRILDL